MMGNGVVGKTMGWKLKDEGWFSALLTSPGF